ncbi:MAG: hypothetical protein QOH39_469 [Verrucomicrobiota bacterium]|jgi:hypothetical protein
MRARSREVNIFNMSLLDILCGALGAFCFMMLVLLPYYNPPASEEDLRKERANTDELVKQMERLKEAAKGSAFAQQMSDLSQKLQDQIKELQGQVNQYAAQNQQLQADNQSLTKKNQELQRSLDQRRPFLTMIATNPRQSIDLYLQDDVVVGNEKRSNPPFNPNQQHHSAYWPGDISAWIGGVASWLVRDSPASVHYKVYAKLAGDPAGRIAGSVDGVVVGENGKWIVDIPQVALTPERFWTLLGTLTGEPDARVSFKEATQQERDAEWTRLSKGAPPPSVASPTAAQTSASPISEEQRRTLLERLKQQQQRRQQQRSSPPEAAPTSSP